MAAAVRRLVPLSPLLPLLPHRNVISFPRVGLFQRPECQLSGKRFASSRSPNRMFATFSWKSFGITAVLASGFIGYGVYLKKQKELAMDKERRRSLGRAAIGGSFELVDQDGKPVSSKDLLGKWILLYFGFSHCPDICPEEMEKMVEVTNRIEKFPGLPEVVPLFITVDPERDTPQIVKSYIREFSPKIIGLTGTKEQVDKATKAYRVYYSAGPKDQDQDYIVDHTIIMYLINPLGEFVDYYGQTRSAEQVTNGILLSIKKFENMNKKSWF